MPAWCLPLSFLQFAPSPPPAYNLSAMKIITTHERTDMDALASMYAASLLHADYQPVLPQNLNRNLRDFLALYKDELPFVSRGDLPR